MTLLTSTHPPPQEPTPQRQEGLSEQTVHLAGGSGLGVGAGASLLLHCKPQTTESPTSEALLFVVSVKETWSFQIRLCCRSGGWAQLPSEGPGSLSLEPPHTSAEMECP